MRIGFSSDVHLDHISYEKIVDFCKVVNKENLNGLVIAGDISNGNAIKAHLEILSTHIKVPIYFVLGNHCYWTKSFDYIDKSIAELKLPKLHFLDISPVITLKEGVAIIGHSGYFDGLNGNFDKSEFAKAFPDFRYISDFAGLSIYFKKQKIVERTQKACDYIRLRLNEALKDHKEIYLVTHVPPYRESSWHMGKMSDDSGAPFFSNKIIGEMLNKVMLQNTDKKLIVLTGHSHSAAYYKPLPNIEVYTAYALYSDPQIYKIFNL